MRVEDIIGVWGMTAWTQRFVDGRVVHPMGTSPSGMLIYTPGGRMSGVAAAGDRPPFSGNAQWDAPEAQRAAAYSSFLAYTGTYSIDGDFVTHHVEVSLFPNWVGHDMRRFAELNSDRLVLIGRIEEGTPTEREVRLEWRRLEGPTTEIG